MSPKCGQKISNSDKEKTQNYEIEQNWATLSFFIAQYCEFFIKLMTENLNQATPPPTCGMWWNKMGITFS